MALKLEMLLDLYGWNRSRNIEGIDVWCKVGKQERHNCGYPEA